ncbi:hypothetical protein [Caballeronia sp. DA-9]|uniref:hypothetical protein n=1 Tax=Caballeronia sp. DA-9 TaxID=3436237 RepID=UPI003F6774B8
MPTAKAATSPTKATVIVPVSGGATALDEAVQVRIDGDAPISCDDIDLFINDKPGLVKCTAGPGDRSLLFTLSRDAADADQNNRKSWAAILGQPMSATKTVHIIVRSGKAPLLVEFDDVAKAGAKKDVNTELDIRLRVFNGFVMLGGLLLVVVVSACTIVGVHMGLGRDSGIAQMRSEELPFSLGRCQMAFWFLLTFWAFCFMYALVGQTDTLNSESLTLMGISAGTALTSIVIDKTKDATSNIEKAVNALGLTSRWHVDLLHDIVYPYTRQPLPGFLRNGVRSILRSRQIRDWSRRPDLTGITADSPISKALFPGSDPSVAATYRALWDKYEALVEPIRSNGFISDLVTDASGPTIGRWQIVAWTVTLGMIYIVSTWEHLELPEFGTTLLSLMGISSGIYLGFKVPEKQVPDAQSQNPANAAKNLPPVQSPAPGAGGTA